MTLIAVIAAAVGLAVGSFLTVLIERLGTGEPIVYARSRCPACRRKLRWFELVPVLSFIAQGGRCRFCRALIPRIYLGIELASAVAFVFLALSVWFGRTPEPLLLTRIGVSSPAVIAVLTFGYYAFFTTVAIAAAAYDFAQRVIATPFVVALTAIGLAAGIAGGVISGSFLSFGWSLAVAAVAFLFFWALWFLSRGRAMGRGDADLAFALALPLPAEVAAAGFFLAFIIGGLFGILAILTGRLGMKSAIPFGPFLVLGVLVALNAYNSSIFPFAVFRGF